MSLILSWVILHTVYIYIYIFNEFHSFLSNTTYNRSTYSIPIELTNFYKTWAHYWYTTNNLSHQQVSNFCITRVSPLSLNENFFFSVFFNINALSLDPLNQVSAKPTETYLEYIRAKRLYQLLKTIIKTIKTNRTTNMKSSLQSDRKDLPVRSDK